MPVRELIRFKHDNQDKLRDLRLVIEETASSHENVEFVAEKLSRSLKQYSDTIDKIKAKYDLETMDLRMSVGQALLSFDWSAFSLPLRIKKAKVERSLAEAGAIGREAAFLYEIGRFLDGRGSRSHEL